MMKSFGDLDRKVGDGHHDLRKTTEETKFIGIRRVDVQSLSFLSYNSKTVLYLIDYPGRSQCDI